MKLRNKDKLYIYYREEKKCFYCSKSLLFKQSTLDHYYPKSLGGSDEIFNLVNCCKKCNEQKGDSLPNDWQKVILNLFLRAVQDGKIRGKNINMAQKILKNKLMEVHRIEKTNKFFVFQSKRYRFYIKNGFVMQVTYFHSEI